MRGPEGKHKRTYRREFVTQAVVVRYNANHFELAPSRARVPTSRVGVLTNIGWPTLTTAVEVHRVILRVVIGGGPYLARKLSSKETSSVTPISNPMVGEYTTKNIETTIIMKDRGLFMLKALGQLKTGFSQNVPPLS